MNQKIAFLFFILLVLAVSIVNAQTYFISTIAGNGTAGYSGDGGPATGAELNGLWGVAVDKHGNIYFGDQVDNRIREIDTNNIITTIAGSGQCCNLDDGGPATDAYISIPIGICVDDSGNIYFNDWNDYRVRKINTQGIISTVAGTGKGGFSGDGGPADSAEISQSYAVATDDSGILYFDDTFNNRVRKVDKKGIITTIAGNGTKADIGDGGPATDASFNTPDGLNIDHNGNIFVSNYDLIRKIGLNDTITTYAGAGTVGHTGDGGPASNAQLDYMFDSGIDDSGNVYVPEVRDDYIRKIYPNDTITTIAGNGVQGFSGDGGLALSDSAEMNWPYGVAGDKFGNLYVADINNQRIRKLSPCSGIITLNTISATICQGDGIALNISSANTYSWSPSTGLSNTTGISVVASPTITTTYTITGTTCTASATITVTVDSIFTVSLNQSTATLCAGQSVKLIASGGAPSYHWSPATGLSDTTGDTLIAHPAISTTYTISAGMCSVPATIVVTVDSIPVVILNESPASICFGQNVTLIASGAAFYTWSPGTGLNTTTGDAVTASPTATTTYTITGTTVGCSGQTTDEVVVSPLPDKPHIAVSGNLLTSSATQGNQWFINDTTISGATNETYTALKSGYYTVTTQNPANGCSSTSDSTYINVTGIEQLPANGEQLSIFPNPATSQLTIINYQKAIQKIEIANVLGQIIFNTQTNNSKNLLGIKQTIDVSYLPDGIYFITVTSGNELITQKISIIYR